MRQQIHGTMATMRNPIRALREAQGIAQADILELIYSANDAGVSTSLVLDRNDPLFPSDRILQRIADHHYWMELRTGERVDLPFTKISVMDGHHNTVHAEPDKYTKIFDEHILAASNENELLSPPSN